MKVWFWIRLRFGKLIASSRQSIATRDPLVETDLSYRREDGHNISSSRKSVAMRDLIVETDLSYRRDDVTFKPSPSEIQFPF